MKLHLEGRRALVTGSSSGLGSAIATMLAAEGCTVVVHGRDLPRATEVRDAIAQCGGDVELATGDLATDEGASAVIEQATKNGVVDILVNNAGRYHHLNWESATPDIWSETYQVNVISGVRMIRGLVPTMIEEGWGRVIQIGGGLASQPGEMLPDYEASLAARHNLAVSLARRLKNTGVTSNIVSPGAILVPAVRDLLEQMAPSRGWGDNWPDIERTFVEDLVPNDIGRLGRPEEVAAAVAFLASRHADYISGASIRVDGGTVKSVC